MTRAGVARARGMMGQFVVVERGDEAKVEPPGAHHQHGTR
jgi:hypothetical protein